MLLPPTVLSVLLETEIRSGPDELKYWQQNILRPPDVIDEMVHPVGYYHFSCNASFSSSSLSTWCLNSENTERVAPFQSLHNCNTCLGSVLFFSPSQRAFCIETDFVTETHSSRNKVMQAVTKCWIETLLLSHVQWWRGIVAILGLLSVASLPMMSCLTQKIKSCSTEQ